MTLNTIHSTKTDISSCLVNEEHIVKGRRVNESGVVECRVGFIKRTGNHTIRIIDMGGESRYASNKVYIRVYDKAVQMVDAVPRVVINREEVV
jgi:hypothetical protein